MPGKSRNSKAERLFQWGCGLLAVALMAYPTVSNWCAQRMQSQVVVAYQQAAEAQSQDETQQALALARAYNRELAAQRTTMVGDGIFVAPAPSQEVLEGLSPAGDGILATLEIPSLDVWLPVYYGTDEANLRRGAGVMEGTSLPVGGAGTHCVLAGHTGLACAKLFSDLDQMEEGQRFFLHVLGETLEYEVDQICVVSPTDTSQLEVDLEQDYVTLLTCTPHGANTHRLLVRGVRVAENREASL